MRKNTAVLLTFLLSLLISMISFFGNPIPARAAHGEIDHYRSSHQYMSMHMIDPDKSGPAHLHTNAEEAQSVMALTDSDTTAAIYTGTDYSLQNILLGIAGGVIFLLVLAFIWKQGRHTHSSIRQNRYNFSR